MGIALASRLPSRDTTVDAAGEVPSEPGVAAPGHTPSPRAADSRARVIDAALRCIARFGVSKTTVDDIAREARLSRATLYRLFPGGREQVFHQMVESEVASFFSLLSRQLDAIESLEDRLVHAMVSSAARIVSHDALRVVMALEPEALLPHVSFAELDQLLDVASSFFAPYLSGLLEPEDARRVGEWVTRLVLSHVVCPHSAIDDAWDEPRAGAAHGPSSPFAIHPGALGEDRARWLVRQFVLPGIRTLHSAPPATAGHSASSATARRSASPATAGGVSVLPPTTRTA